MTALEEEAEAFRTAKAKVFVDALTPYMENLVAFVYDNLDDEDAYDLVYNKLVEAFAIAYTSAHKGGVKDFVAPTAE